MERLGLGRIVDGASAGQAENDAAADEQHCQRRDERGYAEQGDQHAVDDSDRRTDRNGQGDGGTDVEAEPVRVEREREHDGRHAECRSDRQVQILVRDDEGHANRHDGDTGRVAQQRVQRVAGAEERRIDRRAHGKQDGDHAQQADLPGSGQLGGRAPERAIRRIVHDGLKPDAARLDRGTSAAETWGVVRASSRNACRPVRRFPWSRVAHVCRGSRRRCRGRSADRAASPARIPAGRVAGRARP